MISFNRLGNYGHIGNQMFQYAMTKSMAIKYNRGFLIPPKEVFGQYYYTKLRSNIDECFDIKCDRGISDFPTIEENQFSFDEQFFNNFPSHNIDLLGFYQTEKYFKHIENEIRNDFKFIPKYFDESSKIREDFGKEIACIHIRRTDYVNNLSHSCPDILFYQESLKLIPDNCEVLIFSDDPGWCKTQEIFSSDRFLVSETNDSYIDMCLMTMCQYHIIAPSSFSWWGAYLSNTKKVIAPSTWFGPNNSHLDTSNIYLESWIKL